MDLTEATKVLDVDTGVLSRFDVDDIFNPGNTIGGFLCQQGDHRYGALVIDTVNGVELDEPQRVYCTPKLHYPFGKSDDGMNRFYHWPKMINRVEVYTKLDGTNVCAYSYMNASGKRFITFKTRLTPVLQSSRFGDFAGMWRELLTSKPGLKDLIYGNLRLAQGERTLSFEMFGYRNKILVVYHVPLDCRMLFMVDQTDASVYPPTHSPNINKLAADLALEPEEVFSDGRSLTAFYDQKREEAEALNVKTLNDQVEEISGTEGYVFYTLSPLLGREGTPALPVSKGVPRTEWQLWKCKPPSVEDLHWVGDFIPESRIIPTCWNALESVPDGILTTEYIQKMLREEFTGRQVVASFNRIEKAIEYVNVQVTWRAKVLDAYRACGKTFEEGGRPEVMRALARGGCFSGSEMKRVFSTLVQLGLTTAN